MSKDYYICKALERHNRFATEIVNNPQNIIGCFLIGSQNYHLSDEESDVDTVVLVAPTLKEIVTNKKPISKTYIQPNGEHTTIKDIRLFVEGIKKGRLECLEILNTVHFIINDNWRNHFAFNYFFFYFIKQNREKIARLNERAVIQAATGMIKSCNRKNAKPKDLYHSMRLKSFLQKYMNKEPYEVCLVGESDMIACKRKSKLTNDDLVILENNAKMAQEILNNLDDCEYSLTDKEKSEIKKELDAFAMNFVEFGLMGENRKKFNMPKKPITKNVVCGDVNYKRFYCPHCKKLIVTKVNDDFNENFIGENGFVIEELQCYCDNCGQHLDWNGERQSER